MSRYKIAVIGIPKKGSIEKPIKKIYEMGVTCMPAMIYMKWVWVARLQRDI